VARGKWPVLTLVSKLWFVGDVSLDDEEAGAEQKDEDGASWLAVLGCVHPTASGRTYLHLLLHNMPRCQLSMRGRSIPSP